jgi:hypothetical protein
VLQNFQKNPKFRTFSNICKIIFKIFGKNYFFFREIYVASNVAEPNPLNVCLEIFFRVSIAISKMFVIYSVFKKSGNTQMKT